MTGQCGLGAYVTGWPLSNLCLRGFRMTSEDPVPKKVPLGETDFKVMARDELTSGWKQHEAHVQAWGASARI